ncbi:MAG: substrate-binding domain-containing protein [Acetobacteraceae bacterium]
MKAVLRLWLIALVLAIPLIGTANAEDPIRILHMYPGTGPYEAYGKILQRSFMLGLEYATGGKMEVNGRKLVVIEKDTRNRPDLARSTLVQAFQDDKVDIAVGAGASASALAALPVALQFKKILLLPASAADSITGKNFNRYMFRLGRNSSMDSISTARALGAPGVSFGVLAQDNTFGQDAVAAFKKALGPTGATLVHEEYVAADSTDLTGNAQRLLDALKDRPGQKYIWIYWAGSGNPYAKMAALDPGRYGIQLATIGQANDLMAPLKQLPGMLGTTSYYYDIPKNAVNDWLVKAFRDRYNDVPDYDSPGAVASAIAVVKAIQIAGSTDSEKLITALEGLELDTPKGKMILRKEDHQALQSMYAFKIAVDPKLPWGVPTLVKELSISDLDIPIQPH